MINKTIKQTHKKRSFKIFITLAAILILAMSFEYTMGCYEKNLYLPPGQLIDINNHKMHIYAKGFGSPTIVFTVGSGTPCAYTDYYYIQKELQKITRTVSYDRPGFGWSESTPLPRTINNQVNELHNLLIKSGEKPPYILVGHSLASLEVIHYAQLFPGEVSGIILIDGGNPTLYANYSEAFALSLNRISKGLQITGIARILGSIDILLPLVGENERCKQLPDKLQKIDKAMFYSKLGNDFNINSLQNINANAKEVVAKGKLGDIPLVILTAGKDSKWQDSQIDLKNWSSNSKQETLSDAIHYIHWSHSDIVIDRLQEMVRQTKALLNTHSRKQGDL